MKVVMSSGRWWTTVIYHSSLSRMKLMIVDIQSSISLFRKLRFSCVISTMCSPYSENQYINPSTQVALYSIINQANQSLSDITWTVSASEDFPKIGWKSVDGKDRSMKPRYYGKFRMSQRRKKKGSSPPSFQAWTRRNSPQKRSCSTLILHCGTGVSKQRWRKIRWKVRAQSISRSMINRATVVARSIRPMVRPAISSQ